MTVGLGIGNGALAEYPNRNGRRKNQANDDTARDPLKVAAARDRLA